MLEFDIKTSVDEVLKFIDNAEKKLDNTHALMVKSGIIMLSSLAKNFRVAGRPSKWQGLSDMTKGLRRKGRGEGEPLILQDTGRLRGSISVRAEKAKSTIGTNVEYARLMHFGGMTKPQTIKIKAHKRRITQAFGEPITPTTVKVGSYNMNIGSKRVPARPFILFQPEDVKDIERLGIKHLQDATK